jgi:hypothetical protein
VAPIEVPDPASTMRSRTDAILLDCRGGLANRLRMFVGLRALSRVRQVPFLLCWRQNRECNSTFHELFANTDVAIVSDREADEIALRKKAEVYRSSVWFDRVWHEQARDVISRSRFIRLAADELAALDPIAEIKSAVNNYAQTLNFDHVTGFHVRYTDNLNKYQQWAEKRSDRFRIDYTSQLAGFYSAMDRFASSSTCFLSTDNSDVETEVKHRYGDTARTFPKTYIFPGTSKRTSPISSALTELLLLSRCRTIVGTYYSSFSKLSAIWGGSEYFEIRGRHCVRNLSVERAQREIETRYSIPLWRRWLHPFQPLI